MVWEGVAKWVYQLVGRGQILPSAHLRCAFYPSAVPQQLSCLLVTVFGACLPEESYIFYVHSRGNTTTRGAGQTDDACLCWVLRPPSQERLSEADFGCWAAQAVLSRTYTIRGKHSCNCRAAFGGRLSLRAAATMPCYFDSCCVLRKLVCACFRPFALLSSPGA